MQRLLALQPNVYMYVWTPAYMFFLLFAAFASLPLSCSLFLYLLSALHLPYPFHQPQDKHREIHSRDGGQRFNLSPYV